MVMREQLTSGLTNGATRWPRNPFPRSCFNEVERKAIKINACFDRNEWNWRKILRGALSRRQRGRGHVRLLKEVVGGVTPSNRDDSMVWR